MKLAVGCPVVNRAWALPSWFEYLDKALAELYVDPVFVFVTGTSSDNTDEVLRELVDGRSYVIVPGGEEPAPTRRDWSPSRFHHMVEARNMLLDTVRMCEVDYFLSLDSDIMVAPGSLVGLFETIQSYDAVAGKVFLSTQGRNIVNYANLTHRGSLTRNDGNGVFPVEVLMAMKLMTPPAFNIDYQYHAQGEDIGWSIACRRAGLSLAWDGRIISKHVMDVVLLDEVDERVGY